MGETSLHRRTNRDKKRHRIREQLRNLNVDPKTLRRIFADHIRAIRYLRLRNEEVATLDILYRLQHYIRTSMMESLPQQTRTIQNSTRRNNTAKLVPWKTKR